jgi:hypothetical protein
MTQFKNGRIRTVLGKYRSSPVVAIQPSNNLTINNNIPRHKHFKVETDLYKTSTGSAYGALFPRKGNS